MTSRKRNKGKDRKAKKAENERIRARSQWMEYLHWEECGHGCAVMLSGNNHDHPAFAFFDTFMGRTWMDAIKLHKQQICHNEENRKQAIKLLVRVGTNFLKRFDLFRHNADDQESKSVWAITNLIIFLENYDGSSDLDLFVENPSYGKTAFDTNHRGATKFRDIDMSGSSRLRDILKFYRKRTSCSCLKEMHLTARKTLPKLGMCYNCRERKERALLSVCGRCGIHQFCSRECQIENWPLHKSGCCAEEKEQDTME